MKHHGSKACARGREILVVRLVVRNGRVGICCVRVTNTTQQIIDEHVRRIIDVVMQRFDVTMQEVATLTSLVRLQPCIAFGGHACSGDWVGVDGRGRWLW